MCTCTCVCVNVYICVPCGTPCLTECRNELIRMGKVIDKLIEPTLRRARENLKRQAEGVGATTAQTATATTTTKSKSVTASKKMSSAMERGAGDACTEKKTKRLVKKVGGRRGCKYKYLQKYAENKAA